MGKTLKVEINYDNILEYEQKGFSIYSAAKLIGIHRATLALKFYEHFGRWYDNSNCTQKVNPIRKKKMNKKQFIKAFESL